MIGGVLYDKLNKLLLLTITSLGTGIALLSTPFCTNLWLMLSAKFATGFFSGGLDTSKSFSKLIVLFPFLLNCIPYMFRAVV